MEKERKELYIEDLANHGGPESCVGCPRGRRRSVDRGRAGRAIEPRNHMFSSGCRRFHVERKAMSSVALFASRRGTLRGRRTQARTKVFMRENREIPWSATGC
jgi:hypothetical protein